jgi:cobalt/nickel transport protein
VNIRRRDASVMALATLFVCAAWLALVSGHTATGQWPGVDEAVIGRFVDESGHRSPPLFDWVRGDVLLFAFLVAGLLSGFVLGFFARSAFRREEGAR